VLGISGGDPSFRDDDGSANPATAAALAAFAAGHSGEHAALTALASGRLLVPVVAVPAEQASEMAMPTLIGLDGRRAVPAFTCLESMRRWQPDARPVPVAARQVWQTAAAESCAVVIDVAGPVPLAVEGARLAALARGDAVPRPEEDPDVQEAVAAALADELDVAAFQLGSGDADHDLVIGLILASDRGERDVRELADKAGNAVMARLSGRLRRGVAFWFSSQSAD
jgi:hypothetical protein